MRGAARIAWAAVLGAAAVAAAIPVATGSFAAAASGAGAGTGPAQGPAAMDSTVVIAVTANSPLPNGAVLLGKGKGWAWGQVPLGTAAPAVAQAPSSASSHSVPRGPVARLAWIDPASYRESVAGLGKTAQAEAVAKRAANPGEVLARLAEDLAREAGLLAAFGKGPAESLTSVFKAGWRVGRLTGTPAEELTLALDDRAALDGFEEAAAGLSTAYPRPDAALSARTREALVRAAVALGDSALGKAPYRARLLQGYYLPGKRTLLQEAIDRREIETEKLPKGRLALLSGEQAESIRNIEKPLLVFPTPEAYFRSQRLDTPKQRQARILSFARQGGPGLSEYRSVSILKRLDLLARLDEVLRSDGNLPAPAKDALRAAFQAEREHLRAEGIDADLQAAESLFPARLGLLTERLELLARFAAAAGAKEIDAWARHSASSLQANASNRNASEP